MLKLCYIVCLDVVCVVIEAVLLQIHGLANYSLANDLGLCVSFLRICHCDVRCKDQACYTCRAICSILDRVEHIDGVIICLLVLIYQNL